MKSTSIDITSCEECGFYWTVKTKIIGSIPHCNFYNGKILYKQGYSAKEKHPDCRVVNIMVNEED